MKLHLEDPYHGTFATWMFEDRHVLFRPPTGCIRRVRLSIEFPIVHKRYRRHFAQEHCWCFGGYCQRRSVPYIISVDLIPTWPYYVIDGSSEVRGLLPQHHAFGKNLVDTAEIFISETIAGKGNNPIGFELKDWQDLCVSLEAEFGDWMIKEAQ